MKFSCTKENLEHAFTIADHFTGKNVTLPVLGNILLESDGNILTVSATNLEYAVQIGVPGKNMRSGKVCIPAKVASSLIQSIKEEKVDLEEKQGNLLIKTPNRDIRINGVLAEDFPLIPKIKKIASLVMDSFSLQKSLEKVLPAVSPSEFKPELSGVFFRVAPKVVSLAATDTFRLAERTVELRKAEGGDFSFILPQRISQEVARVLGGGEEEIKISVGENQVEFQGEDLKIISRLVEGNFPEYTTIVPKKFVTTAFVERNELLLATRASSIFSSKLQEVTLSFSGKKLSITSANTEVGEYKNEIPAAITGEEITVSFNYRYLLDGLNGLDEEEIFFGINSAHSPSLLRNKSEESFQYVLMPIRIN